MENRCYKTPPEKNENHFDGFYKGKRSDEYFPFHRQQWIFRPNSNFFYIVHKKTNHVLGVNGTEVTFQNLLENSLITNFHYEGDPTHRYFDYYVDRPP